VSVTYPESHARAPVPCTGIIGMRAERFMYIDHFCEDVLV